jgi:hypothetical protein
MMQPASNQSEDEERNKQTKEKNRQSEGKTTERTGGKPGK